MAKCRAEDIKDKVKADLVKDYPNLKTSKIKLLRIEEIVFKIARAQLLGVVKVNTTEQSLSDRLDRLKLEKIDKTSGTIEIDTLKNDKIKTKNTAPKTKEHTLNIGGLSIPYETVDAGSITSLASTNMATGRVRIQEGLTAIKVAEYLLNKEEVEGASATTKSKTKETRGLVVGALNLKYKINIMGILKGMKDNDQLLRKFLLLHEYRHTLQLKKSGGKDAFKVAYNTDPVKFELDADLFALRVLKDEIGLENMTKEDFSLEKAGYTIEKSKSTEPTKSPTEAPKPKQSTTDEKIQKIQQALGALVPLSKDVLENMTDEDVDKYIKSESESTKQKDDTMSSNIVDRTTNNIAKEAKECANNGM